MYEFVKMFINRKIEDSYCNGFFGRRYDLSDFQVEQEGLDWVVIRNETTKKVLFADFKSEEEKEKYLTDWTYDNSYFEFEMSGV